jgi:hypothetical protein
MVHDHRGRCEHAEGPQMTNRLDRLMKLVEYRGTPGKGTCLIARPGSQLPNCHERDFCECEVKDGFARLKPLLDAMMECVDILSDRNILDEIDFNEESHQVLAKLDAAIEAAEKGKE